MKCRDCKHKYCVEYRSGKRFYYCNIKISNYTFNGLKRIKLKDDACEFINTDQFKGIKPRQKSYSE